MKESIFSYLTSYVPTDKRESKEDYLTQMFAWMLKNVEGYVDDYIRFLCSKNASIPCPSDSEIEPDVSTQEVVPAGRIDLVIRANKNLSFICEHKIHSELSENQIKKYMECSHLLGPGTFYSILVTYSTTQHTQPADVSITWGDVCEFTENALASYSNEDSFLLGQFITYLKENGMGQMNPIRPEAMLGYWPAMSLKDNLNVIFSQLAEIDWRRECPGIESFSSSELEPTFSRQRWGRIGIDFFEKWSPGIFAGVLVDTADHMLPPLDYRKGPDLVIFMESLYKKNSTGPDSVYRNIIESESYKKRIMRLTSDSGKFNFLPGLKESPWRIAVLRKSLFDVLSGAYSRQEQFEAVKQTVVDGINLLIQ